MCRGGAGAAGLRVAGAAAAGPVLACQGGNPRSHPLLNLLPECAEEVLEPPDFVSPALLRPLPSGLGTAWHLGDRALLLPDGAPPYPQLAAAWPDVSGGFPDKIVILSVVLQATELWTLLPEGAPPYPQLAAAWPDVSGGSSGFHSVGCGPE